MNKARVFNRMALLGALAASTLAAQNPAPPAPGNKASAKVIERGRYLALEVAKCQDCHTPKTEAGEFDKEKWMKGAVMPYGPLQPIKDWHKTSPDITPSGRLWSRWTEAGLLNYLQTGLTPKGTPAGPPMPTYKLPKADAEAIVAYLKTLP